MILTITMNPSIDISYPLDILNLDSVNRVTKVTKTAGGKGLNVTRVLKQLDADVLASGLLGGFFGDFIKNDLNINGIKHSFSDISGETRNCIAILHEGNQTEILESGPNISEKEANNFLRHFELLVDKANIISISGSLPLGIPKDFYVKMLSICNKKEKRVVLDCSGEELRQVLKNDSKPFAIKPNIDELSDLLGVKVKDSIEDLKFILNTPMFKGIEWVVISMGAKGSFAKHNDKFYRVIIPKIQVVNPVGSGDSTIAGLTKGLNDGETDENILKIANTLGMLNAQEHITGYVNMDNYKNLFEKIKVVEV